MKDMEIIIGEISAAYLPCADMPILQIKAALYLNSPNTSLSN